ncbi:MAG: hypothetical protein K2I79_00595 [Clostridia bacterium]|nr:hypothetical protein [Clostridia bacterium]
MAQRQSLDIFQYILYNNNGMASRSKKKGKVPSDMTAAQFRQANLNAERDKAVKKNRLLYAIIGGILLAAVIIVMIPFNNAGLINVKAEGNFSISLLEDMSFDITLDVPLNTIEVIFAPINTTSASKFVLIKTAKKIKKDYDISTLPDGEEILQELGFSQDKIQKIEGSSAAAYALCWLILLALIALIITFIVCACGKSGMLPPFICSIIYTVLAVVQLGVGIYAVGMSVSRSELTLTFVTGAQIFVNLIGGLALSIVTAVFWKKKKGIIADYDGRQNVKVNKNEM